MLCDFIIFLSNILLMIGKNWGKNAWYFLHITALNYDNINYRRIKYLEFYKNFISLIPCPICKRHFIDNLKKIKYNLENNINSDNIFNWTVDLHNEVNRMNGKDVISHLEAKILHRGPISNKKINKFVLQFIKFNGNRRDKINNFIKSVVAIYPQKNKRVLMNKYIVDSNTQFKRTIYLFLLFSGK
jgi:hypothetical protein